MCPQSGFADYTNPTNRVHYMGSIILLNQTLMKAVPHKVWIPNFDKASELSVLFLIKGKDETAGESVFLNVNCKSKCNPLDLYKFICNC